MDPDGIYGKIHGYSCLNRMAPDGIHERFMAIRVLCPRMALYFLVVDGGYIFK